MKDGHTIKWVIASLGFALAYADVYAQQVYTAGGTSYVGGDYASDGVYAAVTDSQTNTYIGGFLGDGGLTINNDTGISITEPPYTWNLGGNDGFVAKINSSGSLAWYIGLGAGGNDLITGLAVYTNGLVYATGIFERTASDDSGTDARLTALSRATGTNLWTVSIDNFNGTNGFNAVAVDSNGYVYAVGYTTVPGLTANVSGYQVGGVTYGKQLKGDTDAFVAKYSPSGTRLWLHYLGGTNADAATACAVGPDGSVYVGGVTRSPSWATVPSGSPSPSNPDGFIVKLTASGTNVWSAFIGGSAADAVSSLARDLSSPRLFLGGSTSSTNFLAGAARLNTFAGGTDGFVLQFSDLGSTFQTNWCRFAGGVSNDSIAALSMQASGILAVGGTTASGGWLPLAGTSLFRGVQDGFVERLDADGIPLWSTYIGGSRHDELRALAGIPGTLMAAGDTFSSGWVGGGFWSTWTKDPNYNYPPVPDPNANLSYGFISKWSVEPGNPPSVTDDPDDVTVNEGEAATFRVTAQGSSPLTYRWLRNGVPVTGLTSNAYVVTAAARTNNQDVYACLVSNYYGTATSLGACLTVISNSTLTVTLAPPAAVAQGARWSLNNGATWLASGDSTNLVHGTYSVAFTNLTGWRAPATLTSLQLAAGAIVSTSGVYTAVLPTADRSISGTNVTVTVRAPAGLSTWTLVENLPAGFTPTNITASGVWNGVAHTLTYSGVEAFTGTVSYTVLSGLSVTSGVYYISGTVTPLPSNQGVAVTGDERIIKGNLIRTINGKMVTISVYQPSASFNWYVTERLPIGITPINITGPEPVWDTDLSELSWLKRKGVGQTLTYEVSGEPGTYILSGYGHVTSTDEPIFGDSMVTIPGAVIVPPPDIFSFVPLAGTNAYVLTFTSVVNQAYVILTNATPRATNGWSVCLPVIGGAGVTQREVPMTGPRLFYRVRVQ
jgi:hypothetical protein